MSNTSDASDREGNTATRDPKPQVEIMLPWSNTIVATINGDDGSVIGTCTAHLIERGEDPSQFQARMAAPTDETAYLATDLFTSRGRLRDEHRGDEARVGDTSWGCELDTGDILVFEHLKIAKPNRRQGVAKSLVDRILQQAKQESSHVLSFVAPGALESEYKDYEGRERAKIIEEQVSICVQFWHAQGFRRVGGSNWLALADKPTDM